MDQRIDIITVRVDDIESATRYYTEDLGFSTILAVPGQVTFIQSAPGQVFSLFQGGGFDDDIRGTDGTILHPGDQRRLRDRGPRHRW